LRVVVGYTIPGGSGVGGGGDRFFTRQIVVEMPWIKAEFNTKVGFNTAWEKMVTKKDLSNCLSPCN
jgi:carbon monoxide dehydrogenase subunit G